MSSSHEEIASFKIPLEEIKKATDDFADEKLMEQGGFVKVYRGNLSMPGKPTDIVARKLHYRYGLGDLEFWTEIKILSGLKHPNLVSFVGYCDENREKIIVTKYEPNGSLDKHLNDSKLTWTQRLKICVGIASALNYIHYDVERNYSVIHRNIKSSKILLDDNFEPKLSGFGLAKIHSKDRRNRLRRAENIGSIGYMDPIFKETGLVTHKSDVYSLGVVIFEVLCGRRAFVPEEQEHNSPQFDGPSSDTVSRSLHLDSPVDLNFLGMSLVGPNFRRFYPDAYYYKRDDY